MGEERSNWRTAIHGNGGTIGERVMNLGIVMLVQSIVCYLSCVENLVASFRSYLFSFDLSCKLIKIPLIFMLYLKIYFLILKSNSKII